MSGTDPSLRAGRGSVVRVNFADGRWEAIPKALIEDPALSVEARWFAIWLISRGPHWELRASALPRLLKDHSRGVGHVGRDLVRRMLRELERAGYLSRTCRQERSGRWIWESCLNPTKSVASTVTGLAVDGDAVAGEGVDRIQTDLGSDRNYLKRTTTTGNERQRIGSAQSGGVVPIDDLELPEVLSGVHASSARQLIVRCPESLRQPVLDEVAATQRRGTLRNPIGLLSSLVKRADAGEFVASVARKAPPSAVLQSDPGRPVAAGEIAKQTIAKWRARRPAK